MGIVNWLQYIEWRANVVGHHSVSVLDPGWPCNARSRPLLSNLYPQIPLLPIAVKIIREGGNASSSRWINKCILIEISNVDWKGEGNGPTLCKADDKTTVCRMPRAVWTQRIALPMVRYHQTLFLASRHAGCCGCHWGFIRQELAIRANLPYYSPPSWLICKSHQEQ